MKKSVLLCISLIMVVACSDDEGYDEYGSQTEYGDEAGYAMDQAGQVPVGGAGYPQSAKLERGLSLHPFYDSKTGMVSVQLPLPDNWKVHHQKPQGAPTITGPKGLQIYDLPGQSFVYVQDPQMQQVYAQSGQRLRLMPDLQTLIQQDVVPWAQQQGMRVVRSYDLPSVTQIDQWYSQQLYQAVPAQKQHRAVGIDLESADGSPSFLLMHIGQSVGNGMQQWFYYASGLKADKAYYDEAKKRLVHGLANAQYNPAQIQAYNQNERQQAGQSWAAHNQRMRSNQANFEASQRAIVGANNAINDSIMQGWRDRNAAQDRGQEQFNDAMTDRSTMVDPSTGQAWKVESGANNYWMNRDGEYFGTDDYNYNPNADPSMYNQDWQQLEEWE